MRKTKILLSPYTNNTNLYIDNLRNALNNKEIDVVGSNGKKEILFGEYDIIYFNWLELNVIAKSNIISFIKLYAITVLLFYIKSIRKKNIIWTYHNKYPHESLNSNISKKIMNIMFNYADIVIVHSKYAEDYCNRIHGKNKKIVCFEHPNYINNYNLIEKIDQENIINIGFFGAIRQYKGLENLIDAFKSVDSSNIRLSIFGNPTSQSYKDEIINRCKDDSRINLELRFIEEEEVSNVFSKIDIAILPYSGDSFLTSGSSMLALSLKTPIVVPNIAMFKEYEDKEFAILYDSDKSKGLSEVIKNISDMKKKEIKLLGGFAYKYAENISWEEFAKMLLQSLNRKFI